jgi:putative transposase
MPSGLKRFHASGQSHFVTFCCYHRRPSFVTEFSKETFEVGLERVRNAFGLCVYGYVVMPEHVHLLLSEPQHHTLADAIKSLKQGVSRRLIGSADHFWQKRYYDFNVRNEHQFLEKLRYIHRNPVKRGYARGWMIGSGAAICSTQRAARGELRLNASGQRGGESALREGFVRQSRCPTQAKKRLEWATSGRADHLPRRPSLEYSNNL